jgi:gluconate 2-dehydrogenase gamma chain
MPGSALPPWSRRRFFQVSALLAVAAPGFVRAELGGLYWRFLTFPEARTLGVLADIIMPPDADPGGAWAGVVQFIDRKLDGHHRAHQELYRKGLAAIEASSQELHDKPLAELTVDERNDLFARLEQNQLPAPLWVDVSQSDFINRLIEHAMQGFLGGPRHGGNRDGISWRMLGLPNPPVRSRRPESPLPPSGDPS